MNATKNKKVILKQDCEALLIPTAVPITIPSGTKVEITQALGGFITVLAGGNLARVEAKDAAALGLKAKDFAVSPSVKSDKIIAGSVNLEEVWGALRECFDPEIPVNIVELGLVYACEIEGNQVKIDMTLTAPACAMGPVIIDDVKNKISALPNVADVTVNIVFDPIWDQSMMSDVAKLELGML